MTTFDVETSLDVNLLTGQEGIAQTLTDAAGSRLSGLQGMGQFDPKSLGDPNGYITEVA